MRKIKFRGDNGSRFCYGGFYKNSMGDTYIITGENLYYGSLTYERVKPQTVVQLVGQDKDKSEVYEGDKLVDEVGQEYIAEISDSSAKIAELKLIRE